MQMSYMNEAKSLVEHLDCSANSNSYWITLETSSDSNQLANNLLNHLKTGSFHFELVKEDLRRGYYDYSEIIMINEFSAPIVLPKPGNVWNGNENLALEPISVETVKQLLFELLTGTGDNFTKSILGTPLSEQKANELINNLLKVLGNKEDWTVYHLKPNFLTTTEESDKSNGTNLAYFENVGRDLALAIKYKEEVHILLVNGYS